MRTRPSLDSFVPSPKLHLRVAEKIAISPEVQADLRKRVGQKG